jgi:hypothetical protein
LKQGKAHARKASARLLALFGAAQLELMQQVDRARHLAQALRHTIDHERFRKLGQVMAAGVLQ